MIAPGSTCACCESTSGDDPPLPDTGIDVEPSAGGAGIARSDGTGVSVAGYTYPVRHSPDEDLAGELAAAINAAHINAMRELRARCERAERERDEAHKHEIRSANETTAVAEQRDAAIARAELAERVVEAVRACQLGQERVGIGAVFDVLDDYDRARKDGA